MVYQGAHWVLGDIHSVHGREERADVVWFRSSDIELHGRVKGLEEFDRDRCQRWRVEGSAEQDLLAEQDDMEGG